ncbi:MAG: YraN family protein [bacterium]|nr:YraN family protein [bacterium]
MKEKTQKQVTGEKGEQLACDFLVQKGHKIIDRNYRQKWGEIDIISQKDKVWHFVEVKTVVRERLREDDYEPEDNIHPWKIKRLSRAIETYILQHHIDDEADFQTDAIAVYLKPDGGVWKIDYLEEIF